MGLLGVWNSTFLGHGARALLPYSQALNRFAAHIQQVWRAFPYLSRRGGVVDAACRVVVGGGVGGVVLVVVLVVLVDVDAVFAG